MCICIYIYIYICICTYIHTYMLLYLLVMVISWCNLPLWSSAVSSSVRSYFIYFIMTGSRTKKRYGESGHLCLMPVCCFMFPVVLVPSLTMNWGVPSIVLIMCTTLEGIAILVIAV